MTENLTLSMDFESLLFRAFFFEMKHEIQGVFMPKENIILFTVLTLGIILACYLYDPKSFDNIDTLFRRALFDLGVFVVSAILIYGLILLIEAERLEWWQIPICIISLLTAVLTFGFAYLFAIVTIIAAPIDLFLAVPCLFCLEKLKKSKYCPAWIVKFNIT